ncbi:uncharacterized protein B0T15DRAFT_537498 [Chaetomium strumarium]|uniref:Uncharacterized protein n=1 Tax=Chaetomium strumarium TaxID=1170767 RepID=A0AAJ0M0V4_9PEZI|nr:hypothetical protein B0T15DRAFT_537498 [Chaetomium strumarium]
MATTIPVPMNGCEHAYASQTLTTSGLDTCIGVVAYGLPAAPGGINKVMAHCATGRAAAVIGGSFLTKVRNSRMQVVGICMSVPSVDRNDNGPGRIDDNVIRQSLATSRNIHPSQVTQQMINTFRTGLRNALAQAEQDARTYCMQLGVSIQTFRRNNAHVRDPPPYGTMVATRSPRGEVRADTSKMADIPDPVAQPAAPAAGRGASSSGPGRGGYSASSSRPSGASSGAMTSGSAGKNLRGATRKP